MFLLCDVTWTQHNSGGIGVGPSGWRWVSVVGVGVGLSGSAPLFGGEVSVVGMGWV